MTGLLLLDCFAVKKLRLRGATTRGGNCLLSSLLRNVLGV